MDDRYGLRVGSRGSIGDGGGLGAGIATGGSPRVTGERQPQGCARSPCRLCGRGGSRDVGGSRQDESRKAPDAARAHPATTSRGEFSDPHGAAGQVSSDVCRAATGLGRRYLDRLPATALAHCGNTRAFGQDNCCRWAGAEVEEPGAPTRRFGGVTRYSAGSWVGHIHPALLNTGQPSTLSSWPAPPGCAPGAVRYARLAGATGRPGRCPGRVSAGIRGARRPTGSGDPQDVRTARCAQIRGSPGADRAGSSVRSLGRR